MVHGTSRCFAPGWSPPLVQFSGRPLPACPQEHPAIRRLLLPTLRADFRLIESWRPLEQQAGTRGPGACLTAEEGMRLPCSVAALGATEDVR